MEKIVASVSTWNPRTTIFIISVAAALLFIPGLGRVHLFDWDEINFAESAREMIATGDYMRVQINYEPFWEKPPLFFWLQALCMHIFGINEFSARLPNALTGVATLLMVYIIGRKMHSHLFGILWTLAYAGSFLPHFYFKSGIIDPLFNLLIFLGLYFVYISNSLKNSALASLFTGLAVVTKGPVAILVSGLSIFILIMVKKEWNKETLLAKTLWMVGSTFLAGVWFAVETWHHGWWFVQEFVEYNIRLLQTEDSGHGQPWFYHPVVLLVGCFPASLWALPKLFKTHQHTFSLLMLILFWVVLILFSIVKTKIVHYSSLCYLPLTYLSALYILENNKERKWLTVSLTVVGVLICLALLLLPVFIMNVEWFLPYIQDVFARENLLAEAPWGVYHMLPGLLLLGFVVASVWVRTSISKAIFLYSGVATSFSILLHTVAPLVETHVQGAYIHFLKSKQNEDCYIKAIGFKSYAQYYYTSRMPNYPKEMDNEDKLIYGTIDKPVYLITKNDRNHYREIPQLNILTEQNGWVFYKREPK